jgi:hypothetical protein
VFYRVCTVFILKGLGLSVALYQKGGEALIAYGIWSGENMKSKSVIHGIEIKGQIVAIEILKLVIPGAILHLHQKSLKSFGSVPFSIACEKR